MNISVVIGPPCGGVSALIDQESSPGDARVDFGRISTALGADGVDSAPQVVFEAARAARRGVIGFALSDESTSIDGNLWIGFTSIRDDTVDAFTDAGASFLTIDPGIEECLARAEAQGLGDRTIEAIHDWYENPPRLPETAVAHSLKGGPVSTKTIRADIGDLELRSDGDADDAAEFTGYASVFGVKDSYGDIVEAGAFTRTLTEWETRGAPIPVLFAHNMSDPDYNIGHVLEAAEDEHGLKVRCALDLNSPKGKTVHRLLKAGRVREMSFAFSIRESSFGEAEDDWVRYVRDVDLYEVSVVPVGANPEADILAVREAASTDPESNPALAEAMRLTLSLLRSALAGEPGPPPSEPGEGADPEPAAPPDPESEPGDGPEVPAQPDPLGGSTASDTEARDISPGFFYSAP